MKQGHDLKLKHSGQRSRWSGDTIYTVSHLDNPAAVRTKTHRRFESLHRGSRAVRYISCSLRDEPPRMQHPADLDIFCLLVKRRDQAIRHGEALQFALDFPMSAGPLRIDAERPRGQLVGRRFAGEIVGIVLARYGPV